MSHKSVKSNHVAMVGWYGVLAILLAYVLVSFEVVQSKSYVFQLLNLSGAGGIVIEALSKKDRQPVVLNVVWALVALGAIIKLIVK